MLTYPPALRLSAAALFIAGCAAPSADLVRHARESAARGDWPQAIAHFESAAALDPDKKLRASLVLARQAYANQLLADAQSHLRESRLDRAEQSARLARAIGATQAADAVLQEVEKRRRLGDEIAAVDKLLDAGRLEEARHRLDALGAQMPREPRIAQRARELAAVMPPPTTGVDESLGYGKPVSVQFRDSALKTIFEFIAKITGANFVLDKEIRETRTSISAQQVTMDELLHMLLVSNQLDRRKLAPRTWFVHPATAAARRDNQDLMVRAFYLAHSDPKQALAMIKTMVKTRDVHIDEKLNLLVMRDTPEAIRLAERLIGLQDRAEPEVLLEVEVLEVQRNDLQTLGVQWPDGLAVATPPLSLPEFRSLDSDQISVGGLSAGINFRRQDLQADVLANPMIRVRNRERARIHIGDRIPILTATTSATGGFVSESVQYVEVGVRLEVESEVSIDDLVGMRVNLEVSSLGTRIQTNSGSVVFQIGSRSATTALRLRDGETQLLAGLISDQERDAVQSVPGLGEVPVLGWLFRNRDRDRQKTEIVLAITPRVVRSIEMPSPARTQFWSGTETRIRDSAPDATAAPAGVDGEARRPGLPTPARVPLPGAPAAREAETEGEARPGSRPSEGVSFAPAGLAAPAGSTSTARTETVETDGAGVADNEGRGRDEPLSRLLRFHWTQTSPTNGDVVELELRAAGRQRLSSLPVALRYDSAAGRFLGATIGDWIDGSGAIPATDDPARGRLSFDALAGAAEPVTTRDTGTVARLRFEIVDPSRPFTLTAESIAPRGTASDPLRTMLPAPYRLDIPR